MKILTKKELLEAPAGTVYARYSSDIITGQLRIKFGNNCNMDIIPKFKFWKDDIKEERETQWVTDDLSIQADYNDDQLFAVFSNTEITQMIHVLSCALCGGEAFIDMEKVYYRDIGYTDVEWNPVD